MVMMMTAAAAAFAMVVVLLCVRLCSDCIRPFFGSPWIIVLGKVHSHRAEFVVVVVGCAHRKRWTKTNSGTDTDRHSKRLFLYSYLNLPKNEKCQNSLTLTDTRGPRRPYTHTLVSVDSGIAEHIDSLSVTLVDQPIDRKDGRLASWTIRKIVCLFGGFGRMTIVRSHVKQEYVAGRLYCLVQLTFGYWLFSLMGIVC